MIVSTWDSQAARPQCDPDRAGVMLWIKGMVRTDLAELRPLTDESRELRLASGEVFHLTRHCILRIS